MNPDEYGKLAAAEEQHWFYKGKRSIVKNWINRYLSLQAVNICLDIGSGTGIFVREMSGQCRSFGVEPSQEGLNFTAQNLRKNFIAASATDLPFRDESADIITSMDVLEHVENDQRALNEMIRVIKPGGLVVVTVPACPFLMGDWDKSLGHFRRYRLRDFRVLLASQPVQILHQSYINNVLFFPILIYRFLRRYLRLERLGRLEDIVPPRPINWLCYHTFVWPAMRRLFKYIPGLSILLILRRLSKE